MKIKDLIASEIEKAFVTIGLSGPALIKTTNNPELGDYQVNGVMAAAKKANLRPDETAQKVIEAAKLDHIATKVSYAKPGFINIQLSPEFLASISAGTLEAASETMNIVVDYSAPNLAKEMHVGHLRSTIIGDCIARTLEAKGHKVIRQNHVGDWGTQFGMLLTYMADLEQDSLLLSDLENFYRLAKERFDLDADFKERSRQAVVNLQSGQSFETEHWGKFINVSMSHCEEIYKKLRVGLDNTHTFGESSYKDALPTVIEGLEAKNLIEISDGAKCIFFEENKSPLIIQKSDGGYLYATTDLAAIKYRIKELKANRILYFVDSRQSLHFKQIFSVANLAGLNPNATSLEHMAFGTMLNDDGKPFKTREGGLIKLMPLIKEAIRRATETVLEKNPTMPKRDALEIGETVGIAAIKYADLSKNRTNDYIFDWDQMLSLEGNTAPYILYAYTRIQSLIARSAEPINILEECVIPEGESERLLCLEIGKLDDVVDQVALEGFPHLLCSYLYALSTRFSQFYENSEILNQPQKIKTRRLSIAYATGITLKKGLGLLGIDTVTKM